MSQQPLRTSTDVPDIWVVSALFGAVALTAALGFWYDTSPTTARMRHRPRRARFLTVTNADTVRARNMSNYYARIHGTEW